MPFFGKYSHANTNDIIGLFTYVFRLLLDQRGPLPNALEGGPIHSYSHLPTPHPPVKFVFAYPLLAVCKTTTLVQATAPDGLGGGIKLW